MVAENGEVTKAFAALPKGMVSSPATLAWLQTQFSCARDSSAGVAKKVIASITLGENILHAAVQCASTAAEAVNEEAEDDCEAGGGSCKDVEVLGGVCPGNIDGEPPKEILDYSAASLPGFDWVEFFARDGVDLEWEVRRAQAHKFFKEFIDVERERAEPDWTIHDCIVASVMTISVKL